MGQTICTACSELYDSSRGDGGKIQLSGSSPLVNADLCDDCYEQIADSVVNTMRAIQWKGMKEK